MGDQRIHCQRSLRTVFDWSWRLLDPAEQQALASLTVFRAGCEPAAAQAVVGALAPIQRLVARSLVRHDKDGRIDVPDRALPQLNPAAVGASAARQVLLNILISMLNAIGDTATAQAYAAQPEQLLSRAA